MSTTIPIDINSPQLPAVFKPTPAGYDEPEWPRCTDKHTKEFITTFTTFWSKLKQLTSVPATQSTRRSSLTPILSPLISIGLNEATRSFEHGTAKLFVICVPQVVYRSYFPFIPYLSSLLGTTVVTLMCSSQDLGKVFERKTVQAFSINYWAQENEHHPQGDGGLTMTDTDHFPHSLDLKTRFGDLWKIMTTSKSRPGLKSLPTPALLTAPSALIDAINSIPGDENITFLQLIDTMCKMGSIFDILWVKTQRRALLQQHFSDLYERIHAGIPQQPRIRQRPNDFDAESEIVNPKTIQKPKQTTIQPLNTTSNSDLLVSITDIQKLSIPVEPTARSTTATTTTTTLTTSTQSKPNTSISTDTTSTKPTKHIQEKIDQQQPNHFAPSNPFASLGGENPFGSMGNPFSTGLDLKQQHQPKGVSTGLSKSKIKLREATGNDGGLVLAKQKNLPIKGRETGKNDNKDGDRTSAGVNKNKTITNDDSKKELSNMLSGGVTAPQPPQLPNTKTGLSSTSLGVVKSSGLSLSKIGGLSLSNTTTNKTLNINDILNKKKNL